MEKEDSTDVAVVTIYENPYWGLRHPENRKRFIRAEVFETLGAAVSWVKKEFPNEDYRKLKLDGMIETTDHHTIYITVQQLRK